MFFQATMTITSSIHAFIGYSLQLQQSSEKFLALLGIHSPHLQQSNRTTVIDVNSAETLSRPYR